MEVVENALCTRFVGPRARAIGRFVDRAEIARAGARTLIASEALRFPAFSRTLDVVMRETRFENFLCSAMTQFTLLGCALFPVFRENHPSRLCCAPGF